MRGLCILLACTGCEQFFPLEVTPVLPQGARCGTQAAALVDDFDDLDPVWDPMMVASAIEFDGNANFDARNSSGLSLLARPLYDLRESSIEIDITVDVPPVTGGVFAFELRDPDVDSSGNGGNAIRFNLVGGDPPMLQAEERIGPMSFVRANAPYDTTRPMRLQISQARDTTTWSTGVVGEELTTFHSAELSWRVAYVRPIIGTANTGSDFAVRVAPIDGGGETCPADGLQDDFSVLDPDAWRTINHTECEPVADGQLVFDMPSTGGANLCTIETSSVYNLLRHNFTVRTDGSDALGCVGALDLVLLDGRVASLRNNVGQLEVHEIDGVDRIRTGVPYQPDVHRYWRFTGLELDGGGEQLDISTSADGTTFDVLFSINDLSDLDRVQIELGASRAAGPACTMVFDDANVLP